MSKSLLLLRRKGEGREDSRRQGLTTYPDEGGAAIAASPINLFDRDGVMAITTRIRPCLWFDDQAEEAARFYTGIFPDAHIVAISHFGEAGFELHHRPAGSVMTVVFELDGMRFTALNGGPAFTFNEAVSLEIRCATQEEIDYYWERLGEGGDLAAQQCGWLKDRFGLSWQVVPTEMDEMFSGGTSPATERAMAAMLRMKKLDIAELRRAYAGVD
jgi:predicted 3-demethylubiquinone-9 3-methyltransferase (glyoxalase superfamily)